MKKLTHIFIITLCITIGISFAFADYGKAFAKNNNSNTPIAEKGPNFVDKDKDGVCDNQAEKGKGKGKGKGKRHRRGARDGSGAKSGSGTRGANFVDKNGDGICDNRASNKK